MNANHIGDTEMNYGGFECVVSVAEEKEQSSTQ